MYVFVSASARSRTHGLACALLLACGGLAEDGPRAAAEQDEQTPAPAEQRSDQRGPEQRQSETRGAESALNAASWASVGDECAGLDPSGAVVVGTVELRRDAQCGAANWCLRRAPAVQHCPSSVSFDAPADAPACSTSEPDFVAVPPPRSTAPSWQENTCTCRCDGEETDQGYCACPQGMRCAPLIISAGVNAAARAYLGSYCVD